MKPLALADSAPAGLSPSPAAHLLARIDALLPDIARRAEGIDRRRSVDDELIEALTAAGMFATLAPAQYGGLECDLETFSQVVQRISTVSPSTGWVTAFLMGAAWRMLIFPREGQEEIYGGRDHVLGAGSAQPITGVRRVAGGYRLTGRSGWNSGASHAAWFSMNGLLMREGAPPEILMFALPRADVTVIDNWHILGMQGTASCEIAVDDVFVPDHRAAPFAPALDGKSPGHALHDNPMYHIPFLPFAMNEVLPVVVGTHRGAADALTERTRSRLGTLSGSKAAEKVPAQIRMATAQMRAELFERQLADLVADNMAARPDRGNLASRSSIKLRAAMTTDACLASINEMARGVGADALRDGAPVPALLSRYQRGRAPRLSRRRNRRRKLWDDHARAPDGRSAHLNAACCD